MTKLKSINDLKLVLEITDEDDLVTFITIIEKDVNRKIQENFLAGINGDNVTGQLLIN